jgi:hypothetical protein
MVIATDHLRASGIRGRSKTMYALQDTFNNRVISRHRSIAAAAIADRKHQRAVKRHNGQASYIPTKIIDLDTGKSVDWADAQIAAGIA